MDSSLQEVKLWHIILLTLASLVALANRSARRAVFLKVRSIRSMQMTASIAEAALPYARRMLANLNKVQEEMSFEGKKTF